MWRIWYPRMGEQGVLAQRGRSASGFNVALASGGGRLDPWARDPALRSTSILTDTTEEAAAALRLLSAGRRAPGAAGLAEPQTATSPEIIFIRLNLDPPPADSSPLPADGRPLPADGRPPPAARCPPPAARRRPPTARRKPPAARRPPPEAQMTDSA
ncbi:hypothetical protein EYF80_017498 [Liparis tanakae]|uniref:Uncharacterized protein n=1 Tax=Liparis tanakae TaxID=230148 RepID=A0A4Z2I4I3_9TELE|nr:hypothetical protein EYF80_017498 [Liparis tanakae]